MYEAIVIGGGPAGLAATMYCVRKGMDVQLVSGSLGGKAALSLNLPDMAEYHVLKAREQVQTYRARIEYLGHIWRRGRVESIRPIESGFELLTSNAGGGPESAEPRESERVQAERIVLATGTIPHPLNIPGEREFFGKGLGSSAISYSHLLRERNAVVIGNSDRAIEAAMECAMQAAQVCLVLEPHAEYSRHHLEIVNQQDNVDVYNGYRPVRIEGDTFARVLDICRGDEDCVGGRPHKRLEADAFFVEREPTPNSGIVASLVRRDPQGAVVINEKNESSDPRIFAAGDVTTVGVEQILVALGEGARAGLSAYRQLTMQTSGE